MGKAKKAWGAFITAAVGAAAANLVSEIPQTQAGWVALVTGSLGVGLVAALTVYGLRNDPPSPGSARDFRDPIAPVRGV